MKRVLTGFLVSLLLISQAFAQEPFPPADPAEDALVAFPREGFSALAEKLLPSVVNISTTQTVKEKDALREIPDMPQFPPGSPFEDFFKDFMERHQNDPSTPKQRKTTSLGSGFIIDSTGFIVTNNHVIQDADEINVILHDDTSLKATLVGRDSKTDIAVLKVTSSKPLPALSFGDSDKMKVGDWIVVIGNPFGLGGTVTQGIISARARDINSGPYDDYIQTDASINRGNSGGPMFNLRGEVIGISTAIFSPSGGSVGIGFAIPSALAKNVVDQLKTGGKIRRGWLGVRIQNMTDEIAKSLGLKETTGALVSSVTPDSPAMKAGVQAGDVILAFDGKPVNEMRRLPRIVAEAGINRSVPMKIWRDNKEKTLNVVVGEMKDEEEEKASSGEDNPDSKTPVASKALMIPELDAKFAELTGENRKAYKVDDNTKGILLTAIGDNSPLIDKGLQPGDVVVEAAQKEMKDPKDLANLAKEAYAGKKPVLLLIDRQGDLRFVGVSPIDPKTAKGDKK
jgi:serine protease Do